MNNSDGASILDLEASFGSSAGGEVVGYKPTSKSFDVKKPGKIQLNLVTDVSTLLFLGV